MNYTMKVLGDIEQLRSFVEKFFDATSGRVTREEVLTEDGIDTLVWTGVFGPDEVALEARSLIFRIARATGVYPASIHELYMAMGRAEVGGFTVPAMNLRGMTYEVASRVFRVAKALNAGPFIFEIAKSEMGYTHQDPSEYSSVILAAAIKEGYRGPVFIQGDHFQLKAEKFRTSAEEEISSLKELIRSALGAGFFNIDIDASTLVDYSRGPLNEQQEDNFTVTAVLTEYIRQIEPEGVTVSVGAEIGHIGGKNSTVEEAIAFMEGYIDVLKQGPGISKLSVQTGTTHGGVPMPDGSVAEVKLDFSVLRDIGYLVRTKYGLSGTVQHGASTLPDELFGIFPDNNCSEIHLATGFQNIMYEEAPEDFVQEIYRYLKETHRDQWKEGMTEEQFLYKSRKLAFGHFKRQWWELPREDKERILGRLQEKFEFLFKKLRIDGTREVLSRYVQPVSFEPEFRIHRPEEGPPEEGAD